MNRKKRLLRISTLLFAGTIIFFFFFINEEFLSYINKAMIFVFLCVLIYLFGFRHTIRKSLSDNLNQDEILRKNIYFLQRFRFIGLFVCLLFSSTVMLPFAKQTSQYYRLSLYVQAHQKEQTEMKEGGIQPAIDAHGNPYFSSTYYVSNNEMIRLTLVLVTLSLEVGIACFFLSLWVLGLFEIVVLSFSTNSKLIFEQIQCQLHKEKEKEVPEDIQLLILANAETPLDNIRPLWKPDESSSKRANSVMIIQQTIPRFHFMFGCKTFFFWILWSIFAIVIEIVYG